MMNGVVLKNGRLQLKTDLPIPTPAPNEALLRVRLAGICATDIELSRGYAGGFNGVLGHEFVGEVVEASDASWIGQRVVGSINIGCGNCPTCHQHGPEHCPSRRVVGIHDQDGAFAEYITLPLNNLLPVPDEVPDETAVFVEPLAAAVRIREQLRIDPTARTAVIGPGRLGLLVAQVLALAGGDVTVIGRRLGSLELPEQLGLKTAVSQEIRPNQFDFVVETTGNGDGFRAALEMCRPLGTVVLKSTYAGEPALDLTKLVVAELTVIGSRCGPFVPAMRLLQQSAVQVTPLIAQIYPLGDALTAFEHAQQRDVRKILLRPFASLPT